MRSRTSRRSLSSSCSALPRQQYVHIALSPVRSSATARKRRLATSRRCSPHGTLRRCARSASASIHAFQDRHTHRVRTRDVRSTFATPSARGPHFVCLRRRSCNAVPVRRITPSFPPPRFPRVSAACVGSRTVVEVRMVPKFALQRVAIASVSFRSNPPCACASTMRFARFPDAAEESLSICLSSSSGKASHSTTSRLLARSPAEERQSNLVHPLR